VPARHVRRSPRPIDEDEALGAEGHEDRLLVDATRWDFWSPPIVFGRASPRSRSSARQRLMLMRSPRNAQPLPGAKALRPPQPERGEEDRMKANQPSPLAFAQQAA
jgi:hypothetical protein